MNENNIPKHWQIKKLGEVCKLKNGYAFKSGNYESNGVPVIRISDINGGFVSSKNVVRVIPKDDYEDYQVEENDILVAMSGATTGKFGIYKSSEKAYQNQRVGKFKILDERILNNNFLFYQINSLKRQIEKDAYGGAQPNISSSKIEQMQIVVPPLPEQQAIVAKIEELFSELENGKQQLLTAQQQLKVYRQSLLKCAFEGKLTNKNVKEGELPEGWKNIELRNITESIQYGYTESSSKEVVGPKFLRITDIQDNKVDWDTVPYCKIDNETKKKYLLREGDLVFARTGATVGKSFLIKGVIPDAVFASYLIRVRVNLNINEKYLSYFFHSPNYWSQITEGQVGIGQPNVNGTKLGQLKIIIPPIIEQKLIVSELESKLTLCDKIEETIAECLQQTETLKQSILKKAFEGKLI